MKKRRVLWNFVVVTLAVLFVFSSVFTFAETKKVYASSKRTVVVLPENLATGQMQSGIVSLYRGNAMDGERFAVDGMFPGDSFSYNYHVDVSFKNTVTLSLKINVRDGYEKLAEVLKFKVENITGNSTLYDGTAENLPEKWDNVLVASVAGGETVRTTYSITAYLDKSVGNDYQDLSLVADFTWEVEGEDSGNEGGNGGGNGGGNESGDDSGSGNESGNLIPSSPNTGDKTLIILAVTTVVLGIILIAAVIFRMNLVKGQEIRSLKRFRRSVTSLVLMFAVMCAATVTYAYYVAKNVENNEFTTGVVDISLSNESTTVAGGDILLEPGATSEKVFKLTNDSTCEVYYKLYFSNIEGELADILEISVVSGNEEIFSGIMSEMTRSAVEAADEALAIDEEKELKVLFHMPEECGNEVQAKTVEFDINVDAVQAVNNTEKEF